MGVRAIAVEVLRGGAALALWSLPQLPQVGVDVAGAVARSVQAVGQHATATGAGACARLAATVARPHQPVLLVVAEVLRIELLDHCPGYQAIISRDTSLLDMFMI